MSKVFESFILDRLKEEIKLKPNQYGGIKGCGTNHFLAETWHNIFLSLEDNRAATTLMSTDFSKAFNRMDHATCVKALAKKGASTQTIQMVAAFLNQRCMRVKVGSDFSEKIVLRGGSPQGT